MPDPWEYPWFAAWDLAFHCVTLAHIDPAFAKSQLVLLLREWYMHPNGQIPAYEWNFSDVNPPVHAWAAIRVFEIDGGTDFTFLARIFHKLLINFTWWVNNKDHGGNNLFQGGFMGLDNIAPLDRSTLPPELGYLEQADSTAWMAMYALDLLDMALRLALHDSVLRGRRDQVLRALPVDRRRGEQRRALGRGGRVLLRRAASGRRHATCRSRSSRWSAWCRSRAALAYDRADSSSCRSSPSGRSGTCRHQAREYLRLLPRPRRGRRPAPAAGLVPPERLVRVLDNVFDEAGCSRRTASGRCLPGTASTRSAFTSAISIAVGRLRAGASRHRPCSAATPTGAVRSGCRSTCC